MARASSAAHTSAPPMSGRYSSHQSKIRIRHSSASSAAMASGIWVRSVPASRW
jgi:hypothetical protein